MVNPLQAQLIKAGLAKAGQIKKVEKQKRDAAKRGAVPDRSAEQLRQAQQQKADSDRLHNRQQQEQRERRAQAAQIRQLIETQRLDRGGGESAYQFVEAGKIRKIHLHEAQRVQVVRGTLAVVRLGRNFELVPLATAEKIARRDPACVLVLNAEPESQAAPVPDPYADFPVPDDLMW